MVVWHGHGGAKHTLKVQGYQAGDEAQQQIARFDDVFERHIVIGQAIKGTLKMIIAKHKTLRGHANERTCSLMGGLFLG